MHRPSQHVLLPLLAGKSRSDEEGPGGARERPRDPLRARRR